MSLEHWWNNVQSNDYIKEICKGNVDSHACIRKFFKNPNTRLNTEEEIWDYAPTELAYTYTSNDGADYYLCSDNAGDTQVVYVYLLDANFDLKTVEVQLNGQTPVKIGTEKYTRVYRMFNLSPVSFLGSIYCVEGNDITAGVPNDTKDVRAYVDNGNNITLMCQFTIPNDTYGLLLGYTASIINKQAAAADISAWGRLEGTSFHIRELIGLNTAGNSYVTHEFKTPVLFPPITDVTIKSDVSAAGVGIVGSYDLLLIRADNINLASNRIII